MFTRNLLFLGDAITIILIRCTFIQNVYVLNNSYIMIYIYRMYSTDRTLNSCIFILHPRYTANRTDMNFHVY